MDAEAVEAVVGRRPRMRRRLLGKTQQEVATACGVTFQQVQEYETADCRLSVAMLWKLAGALEIDIGYFFAGMPQDAGPAGRHAKITVPKITVTEITVTVH